MTPDERGEQPGEVDEGTTLSPVPNQPKTPMHSFRVPDDLWLAAIEKARQDGTNLTAVLNDFLRHYADDELDD